MAEPKETKDSGADLDGFKQKDYPVIGFGVAIDLAKKLYQMNKTAPMRLESVFSTMGYSDNGRSRRMVAALKKFGLLEGEEGNLRVTRVVAELTKTPELFGGSKARELALKPAIFQLLAGRYKDELPADNVVILWLEEDMKFSEASARMCLNAYKDTVRTLRGFGVVDLTAARIEDQPRVEAIPESTVSEAQLRTGPVAASTAGAVVPAFRQPMGAIPISHEAGFQVRPWNLGDNAVMQVTIPSNLSRQNIEKLKRYVAALEVEAAINWDEHDPKA